MRGFLGALLGLCLAVVGSPALAGPPVYPVPADMAPLNGLRRQSVELVALLGDSRVWNSTISDTSQTWPNSTTQEIGLAYHIMMQTGGRVEFPQRLNFGVASTKTSDQVGRTFAQLVSDGYTAGVQPLALANYPNLTPLEAAAQSDARIVLILTSTNDRTWPLSAAQTISNLTTMLDRLQAAGKTVIIVAEAPRGDTTYTSKRIVTPNLYDHMSVASWIRALRRPNVFVVDAWPQLAAASSSTGDALVGATYDGLHDGFAGSWILGGQVAAVLNVIVPPVNRLRSSNTDVWNSTNQRGALVANPMLTGTGGLVGSASGVTISGTLPDSISASYTNLSGVTVAYGRVTINSISYLSVTLSGTPTGASPNLQLLEPITIGAIATGDAIQTVTDMRAQPGASGFTSFNLQQSLANTGGTLIDVRNVGGAVVGSTPTTVPGGATGAWGGTLVSEPSVAYAGGGLGSASSRLRFKVDMTQNVAVSATLLIGPTDVRKVF